jgi:hypothetical protein
VTIVSHIVIGQSTSALVVPDGSPSYSELRDERDRLLRENARLVDQLAKVEAEKDGFWDTIEDIACGARIECSRCGKPRPCLCMDSN